MKKLNFTAISQFFDNSDGLAKSRRGALLYTYISMLITNLVANTYFISLMLEIGASEGFINTVNVMITVCGFLQLLSPLLLEKLKQRKTLLIAMRIVYHVFYIIVIGVIPLLKIPFGVMLGLIMASVVISNVINAASLSGISVWYIQNVREEQHSDFFAVSNVGSMLINMLINFLAGVIVDAFSSNGITAFDLSPTMLALIILRIVAIVAAVAEILCLCSIKEHPYAEDREDSGKINLKLLFEPLSNRKFMKTTVIYIAYFFISGLIGKYFEIYLIDVVKMSYTFKSLSGVLSAPIVLLISPLWSHLLRKFSWRRVLPIAITGTAVGYFFNTVITPETQFFHIPCIVFYSSFYIAVSTVFGLLPYVNMPEHGRTAYLSFFTVSGTAAGLIGNLAGMLFMNLSSGLEYYMFGLKITNYQTLNLIQTVSFLLLAAYTLFALRGEGEVEKT